MQILVEQMENCFENAEQKENGTFKARCKHYKNAAVRNGTI